MKETAQQSGFLPEQLNRLKLTGLNIIYITGCIVSVLACFMPYVYSEQKTMSLMEGTDGIFFLMFAVLIFIFIAFEKEKVVGVLGLVMVYFGIYELTHTYGVMSKTGQAVSLKTGYFVLLAGTIIMLAGVSYFVYRNGLKDIINKVFDRLFPMKDEKK